MTALRVILALALVAAATAGCTREARTLAADQPETPPNSADDPRAQRYEGNYYQVSQGGLYFTWYGCGTCHGTDAKGVLDLADGVWRHGSDVKAIYAFIATGHSPAVPRYGDRIPAMQLWQITAFVQDLAKNDPAKNRRSALDELGQPQGGAWQGPLR